MGEGGGGVKLSQAIREGATLRPQAFDSFFDGDCSCALGAAAEAVGANDEMTPRQILRLLENHWPGLLVVEGDVRVQTKLYCKITRLNDIEKRTREEIADILEKEGH